MRSLGFVLLLSLLACDEKKPAERAAPSASAQAAASMSATPPVVASSSPPAVTAAATPPEQIAAQHVLVAWKGAKNAPASITRSKADAKKRADEVAAKAKADKAVDFSALVAEYSDDEGTKGRQGSLGKFAKSKMTPAFADAAFALAVDQVSDPVETPFGYHVIKRNQ
jgi:peptidyl-prolyl cis-trans isomerase NIMA-interacting 1